MFWLFRRKKVADKTVTPCVCDNETQLQGAFTLREFASTLDRCLTPRTTSEGALSRLTFNDPCRSTRKGYHRLQGDGMPDETTPRPPPVPPPRVPPPHEPEGTSSPSSTDYSDCDHDFTENTDSDDEELTCSVCDRVFRTVRQLEQHQQRKRHYGCCICDSIFPNLMALELHKETLDHWSEDELRLRHSDSDEEDDYSLDGDAKRPEELERLL